MVENKFDKEMGFKEVQKAMDERIQRLAARVDDMETKRHEAITRAMEMYDKEIQAVKTELDAAQQTKSALLVQKSKDSSVEMAKKCEAASLPKPTQNGFAGGVGVQYGSIKIPAAVVNVVTSWANSQTGLFYLGQAERVMLDKFPKYQATSASVYVGSILKRMAKEGKVIRRGKAGDKGGYQYVTKEAFAKLKNDDIAVVGPDAMVTPLSGRKGEST